jgi:ABC transporter substrate binding protein
LPNHGVDSFICTHGNLALRRSQPCTDPALNQGCRQSWPDPSVEPCALPGGNATGFTPYDYSVGAKWLELLKEIAPNVKRIGVLRDPTLTLGTAHYAAIQSMAPTVGVEVIPIGVRDAGEIERGIGALARISNAGLIVTGSALIAVHRHLIIALAAQHKLPAIYYERFPVKDGGLLSYGPNFLDQWRSAAGYVDRIPRGARSPGIFLCSSRSLLQFLPHLAREFLVCDRLRKELDVKST